jgi:hypothetical protein
MPDFNNQRVGPMIDPEMPNTLVAEFTSDMLHTLVEYFDHFACDEGVISIEVNMMGIWLEDPNTKTKKFVGKARLSEQQKEKMRQAEICRKEH